MPSALLPLWSREKVVADIDAAGHRRGTGLSWPPEAQVPVNLDPKRGSGRVPLVAALGMLLAEGLSNPWSSSLNASVSWMPGEGRNIQKGAAQVLADACSAYSRESKSSTLIIPESFSEGAQQALLDAMRDIGVEGITLLPRSIAIALQWCQEKEHNYQHITETHQEGEHVGHLLCCSLGMGPWESSLIEIRGKLHDGRSWLFPVHDPQLPMVSIGWCGIGLCKAMLSGKSDQEMWKSLFAKGLDSGMEGWFDECLKRGPGSAVYSASRIEECLQHNASASVLLSELSLFRGLKQLHKSCDLRDRVKQSLAKQKAHLGPRSDLLGCIVSGSFSNLEFREGRRIGNFLYGLIPGMSRIESKEFRYSAKGAARAALAIFHGLPSYRAKLVPIGMYVERKDELGDVAMAWKPLVAASTVEAGKTYKPDPITGLHIKEGSETLSLSLRRPDRKDGKLRRVQAVISERTSQDENVILKVAVRPGQGLAKVEVVSEKPGVFQSRLDWKTMVEISEEELDTTTLAYIPKVCHVLSCDHYTKQLEPHLHRAISEFSQSLVRKKATLEPIRKIMNKWVLAKTCPFYHNPVPEGEELFEYVGAVNSSAPLSGDPHDRELLEEFLKSLSDVFERSGEKDKLLLLNLGCWLYESIPDNMLKYATKNIRASDVDGIHKQVLYTAGLSFHDESDLCDFYKAFVKACKEKSGGLNNWLRAFRNIVQFRQNGLSDDVVENHQIEIILNKIIELYDGQVSADKYHQILNNCLRGVLFILKRRRYDPSFLPLDDPRIPQLEKLLQITAKKHRTPKYSQYAESTLKFLKKEATISDTPVEEND